MQSAEASSLTHYAPAVLPSDDAPRLYAVPHDAESADIRKTKEESQGGAAHNHAAGRVLRAPVRIFLAARNTDVVPLSMVMPSELQMPGISLRNSTTNGCGNRTLVHQ